MARPMHNHRAILLCSNARQVFDTESRNILAGLAGLRDFGGRIVVSATALLAGAHDCMFRRICCR